MSEPLTPIILSAATPQAADLAAHVTDHQVVAAIYCEEHRLGLLLVLDPKLAPQWIEEDAKGTSHAPAFDCFCDSMKELATKVTSQLRQVQEQFRGSGAPM